MKKRTTKIIAIAAVLAIAFSGAALWALKNTGLKYRARDILRSAFPDKFPYYMYYQNNELCLDPAKVDFDNNDVREVQVGKTQKYLINHSRGFALGFPLDAEFDFSAAQEYITVRCPDMTAVVSKEYSTYASGDETKQFVDDYLHKYLLNDRFIEQNKITVHKNAVEKIGDYWVQTVAITRTPAPDSPIKFNTYCYCYIYTGTTMFYRIMFKTSDYTKEFTDKVYRTLYSFSEDVPIRGISSTFTSYKPSVPEYWSEETKEFYSSLVDTDTCKWGLYVPLEVVNNDFSGIHRLEEETGTKFEGLIEYRYYFEDMPIEGMTRAYNEGKIVELTVQTSTVMNEELDGYNPVFDIIDGKYDYRFEIMAHQIKEFSHPVLFRLNNEMNSDWTSYGSSDCLDDPEIYVELWRKIYDIFRKVGVDNAIWVFNPNDQSFPPCGYNSVFSYYPGDEYVQVFGVTGYNTGIYYAKENGERWRTFSEIYDGIIERYEPIFGDFPWIITEFASSSFGGDKAKWIEDMFSDLEGYKNIKMAFWFNSADMDTREGKPGKLARPYWLDENEETIRAFSEGIKKNK